MQTELEKKGIKKRTDYTLINSTKKYGKNNDVKGKSSQDGDEYSLDGSKAKKGGQISGSLVNHLNQSFDLTTGGDSIDMLERQKQLGYVIPGKVTYSAENIYSDVDDIKINTDENIGQVVIY